MGKDKTKIKKPKYGDPTEQDKIKEEQDRVAKIQKEAELDQQAELDKQEE